MRISRLTRLNKILLILFCYIVTAGVVFILLNFPFSPRPRNWFDDTILIFAILALAKFFFYHVIGPWHELWTESVKGKHKMLAEYQPLVSVVIPAWNEEVGLVNTVKSVLANTYPKIQIIVINDGSTDSSHELFKSFVNKYKKTNLHSSRKIIYKYQQNAGKGSALNFGISIAQGEIILTFDADCYVSKQAITNFVRYFCDPNVMAVVGNVQVGNTSSFLGEMQFIEFLFSFYNKKADSILNSIYIIGGAAGGFRKEVFNRLGTYTTGHITEDIELSMRIQEAGMKIVYASDAEIFTEGADSIGGLAKQRLRWRKGRYETFKKYQNLFFSKEQHHSKFLSFLVLPLSLVSELQLFLEPFFFIYILAFFWIGGNPIFLLSGIILVAGAFFLQAIFAKLTLSQRLKLLTYAPIGWMFLLMSAAIEYVSQIKSLWLLVKGRSVVWQTWQRRGVGELVKTDLDLIVIK